MRKHFALIFLLLFSNLSLLAQVQEWVARYNGPGNGPDVALAITQDDKGNVYVTGGSTGTGTAMDYATIKYDRDGNEVWVARYNGPGNGNDAGRAIALDTEGNVYVTGYSWGGPAAGFDWATIKYDVQGNDVWIVRYNSPENGNASATALALDTDGSIYVTGWSRDGGSDVYTTIKYDAEGRQVWIARYRGPASGGGAYAIALDGEGNIYVTGENMGVGTGLDYATVKYDAEGNQLWVARYDGPAHGYDDAVAIAVDSEGNAYVTGRSPGIGTSSDYATIKYDTEGNELWVARYDGPLSGWDEATALGLDGKGNVYVTGWSTTRPGRDGYEYTTVGYDTDGNEVWVARYSGPSHSGDIPQAMTVSTEGDVYVTGLSTGTRGWSDYATIKYSSDY